MAGNLSMDSARVKTSNPCLNANTLPVIPAMSVRLDTLPTEAVLAILENLPLAALLAAHNTCQRLRVCVNCASPSMLGSVRWQLLHIWLALSKSKSPPPRIVAGLEPPKFACCPPIQSAKELLSCLRIFQKQAEAHYNGSKKVLWPEELTLFAEEWPIRKDLWPFPGIEMFINQHIWDEVRASPITIMTALDVFNMDPTRCSRYLGGIRYYVQHEIPSMSCAGDLFPARIFQLRRQYVDNNIYGPFKVDRSEMSWLSLLKAQLILLLRKKYGEHPMLVIYKEQEDVKDNAVP